jgi:hypothetical protein
MQQRSLRSVRSREPGAVTTNPRERSFDVHRLGSTSNPAASDRLTICKLQAPVRHTVIAILRPAYPPSAKMRSMNGNSRRAWRSKYAIAVLKVGGMNDNVQEETQRVDQDVPLARCFASPRMRCHPMSECRPEGTSSFQSTPIVSLWRPLGAVSRRPAWGVPVEGPLPMAGPPKSRLCFSLWEGRAFRPKQSELASSQSVTPATVVGSPLAGIGVGA